MDLFNISSCSSHCRLEGLGRLREREREEKGRGKRERQCEINIQREQRERQIETERDRDREKKEKKNKQASHTPLELAAYWKEHHQIQTDQALALVVEETADEGQTEPVDYSQTKQKHPVHRNQTETLGAKNNNKR